MNRRSLAFATTLALALSGLVLLSLEKPAPPQTAKVELPPALVAPPRPIFPPLAPSSPSKRGDPEPARRELPAHQIEIPPPPLQSSPKFGEPLEARLGFQVAIAAPAGAVGLATVGVFLPDGTPLGHRKFGGMQFSESSLGALTWQVRDFVLDLDEAARAGAIVDGPPWWITVDFEGTQGAGGPPVRRTGAAPLSSTEEWWGAPISLVEVITEDFDERPGFALPDSVRASESVHLLRRGLWGPIEVTRIDLANDPRVPELPFLPSVLVRRSGESETLSWEEFSRRNRLSQSLGDLAFEPVFPRSAGRSRVLPLRDRPPFDGILKREVGLQVAVAAPLAFEGMATICVALEDGTPLHCEQRSGIEFSSVDSSATGSSAEGPPSQLRSRTLDWRVLDFTFDLALVPSPIDSDNWVVTVDLVGLVDQDAVLRSGLGRLEANTLRLLEAPPLVEVLTEDSRNLPKKEVAIQGSEPGYRISRQTPRGPSHLVVVFESDADIPELAFPETEVVRFFADGDLPFEVPFEEIEPGESLSLEEGAVLLARPLTMEALPRGVTLSATNLASSSGEVPILSGVPIELRPVPAGKVLVSLRLRRIVLWAAEIEVEPGSTDISSRLPDLFELVRPIELRVQWPPGIDDPRIWGRIEASSNDEAIALVNLGAESRARFLVPIDESGVRTLTWIAPEPGLQPMEIDLSRDLNELNPVPRPR